MSLTVTNVFADGTTIDASKVNKNFDDVEAKFNAGVDATDLKAKYYRFPIILSQPNLNQDLADNVAQTLLRTTLPADGSLTIERVHLYVSSMAAGTCPFSLDLNTGAGWTTIYTVNIIGGTDVSAVPTTTAIPGGATLRASVDVSPGVPWSNLYEFTFTIWCKQVVKEA